MNKKLLLIPVAMMAIASCNKNSGSEPSVSIPVAKEYISAAALRSITGSFTAEGVNSYYIVTRPSEVYEQKVRFAFSGDAIEYGYGEVGSDDFEAFVQYFEKNGAITAYFLNAQNELAQQYFYDSNTQGYAEWEYSNDLAKVMQVSNFEKVSDGVYMVNSQSVRNAIHETILNPFADSEINIASMEVTVEDDKIVKLDYATEPYKYQTLTGSVNLVDEYSINITDHKTTEIVTNLKPYESYSEANRLESALNKISDNVTMSIEISYNSQKTTQTIYVTENQFYAESQGIIFAELDELDGIVQLSVSEEGLLSIDSFYMNDSEYTYDLKEAGLAYCGDLISPLMFEYNQTSGKYVTRNADDAYVLGSYLIPISTYAELVEKIEITLTSGGDISEVVFTCDDGIGNKLIGTITYSNIGSTAAYNIDSIKDKVLMFSKMPEELLGWWQNADYLVTVNAGSILINDIEMDVTSISSTGVVTGNYIGGAVTLTYDDENWQLILNIGGADVVLNFTNYFVFLSYLEYLGIDALPNFTFNSLFAFNTSFLSYDMLLVEAYDFVDGYTSSTLTEWVTSLLDSNDKFMDVTTMASSEIFYDGDARTIADYLAQEFLEWDVDYVLYDGNYLFALTYDAAYDAMVMFIL